MALHARSVAIAAGAIGADVERVAQHIHALGDVTLETARITLLELSRSLSSAPPPSE
jgi:hydroxymethylglutaryl-CoA reductase